MKRKTFLKRGLAGAGLMIASPILLDGQNPEIFSAEEISEFVLAAHGNLDFTAKILERKPLILNCTNQGRRGDFETGVGGASHVGNRDIADLLVKKGARLDMFNYAFLGYTDFIIKLITDYPDLLYAPGPHGFTLLHHARKGEDKVLEAFLLEKGLTKNRFEGVFG